ncbi:MAG TPA: cytochrome c biogenesis protein CcdA [Candidatus Caenarcaniphilales bacterium]|nr:cytochrome c biogenesis protein CcdA [Candidatus Caenarcaniphilales bacterium]
MIEALAGSFVVGFGSAASPCLLPLYPAFLAFLAGRQGGNSSQRLAVLGLSVVLGVVTMLVIVGIGVSMLALSLGRLLAYLVPATTVVLLVLGILLLVGRNPFATVASVRMPVVRRPIAQAYVYGLLFGPVALPCAGPFLVALLAISIGLTETAERLLTFVAFGVGMGAPLLALSLVGEARRRAVATFLARHQGVVARVAGIALIVAALAQPAGLLLQG